MSLTPKQQQIKNVYDQLRDYQKDVFKMMVQKGRWLNYMKMGMGKTLTTALAAEYLGGRWIIVGNVASVYVWKDELMRWFEEPSLIYMGKPKERAGILKDFLNSDCRYIITNYSLVKELASKLGLITVTKKEGSSNRETVKAKTPTPTGTPPIISGIIADEIHRAGLFNQKTMTFKVFDKLGKVIPYVFLLTGTPYRKGVVDFYGPLHLVAPDDFPSYWKFVDKHCLKFKSPFGVEIDRHPANPVQFRKLVRQYASILEHKDHLHELPGKQRQLITVQLDGEQKRVYQELTDEMVAETDSGNLIFSPSHLTSLLRQRQLLVAPQMLGLKTRGAAIDVLIEMAGDLYEDSKPFVVFTPFKAAIPWIEKALEEEFQGISIYTITGALKPDEFREQWQGFQNGSGPRALLCVIQSGTSFHSTVANTCFFLGYEWDFNQNEQAEDRLNRIGQKSFVNCYYITYPGTVDDLIRSKLNEKKHGADIVLSSEEAFRMLIKRH